MDNMIVITICLAGGFILQNFQLFEKNASITLNQYVIWIALPALILRQIPELEFKQDLLICVTMPWIMVGAGVIFVRLGTRIFRWKRKIEGALMLMVPLANTSFLGIPMITAFFGPEMVPYGILYDQFGSFLALSIYGSTILAIYTGNAPRSPTVLIRKIVAFPPFIALAAAVIFQAYLQHPALESAFQSLGNSLVPVVMFAIGLQLKIRLPKEALTPFAYGLLCKLVIAPLLALTIVRILNLQSPAAMISVFEAGMPPMVTAGALAISSGLVPELVAAMTGWGIVLSFLTLPLLRILL